MRTLRLALRLLARDRGDLVWRVLVAAIVLAVVVDALATLVAGAPDP